VSRVGAVLLGVIGVATVAAVGSVQAQSNLDAGKSPAQIFSDTCGACHRSPRELKQTSPGFLREHYTTGGKEAAAMAAYLASIGSDPRAVQQRPQPALGAGRAATTDTGGPRPPQTTPPGADQAKPPEARAPEAKPEPKPQEAALPATRRPTANGDQAKPAPGGATAALVKPRRPSESVEAGTLAVAAPGGEFASTQPAAVPSAKPPAEDFEE
jgi:hypothetical protein